MRLAVAVRRTSGEPATAAAVLSRRLRVPLVGDDEVGSYPLLLEYQDDRLVLADRRAARTRPVTVELETPLARYRSLPAPKRGPLARAVGRKTRRVIDATAGWGGDLARLMAMGYQVTAVERSEIVAALLEDGLRRLELNLPKTSPISLPVLVVADALSHLKQMPARPDCVFVDPMFPPKRKRSALARRPLRLLREIVGGDEDRESLIRAAARTARRVVVKRPNDVAPVIPGPDHTCAGKLVCYDVYLGKVGDSQG